MPIEAFLTGSQTRRSLHFTAESVDSSLLVLDARSCSVVTSHSALRNEGNSGGTHPMPWVLLMLGTATGARGNPRAPNVLVSHWMIVGSGIDPGGNEYKVKCVAVN